MMVVADLSESDQSDLVTLRFPEQQGSIMVKMSKFASFCAIAALLCAMPYSLEVSKTNGISVTADEALARVGRPLTPGSVAGVARRTTRRTIARHSYYGHHHHHCVWIVVSGVRVCR
jgi:hypothetical protein